MALPWAKWLPGVSTNPDNAAAVDKGGGEVGIPITGHGFEVGQTVTIDGSVNYDGDFVINSETADEIVITATYVAETFAGTETVESGREIILKSDLLALWTAISEQPTARMQPPLEFVDTHTVRVNATADCPAETVLSGMPNVLNYATQVDGGLSDWIARTITSAVACDLASGGLYGTTQTEKASQWYAIFATAAAADTDFELKAMPFMRVKSQASQVISLGTLLVPGTGIGYGFTADDLVGGKVYFLSGASVGLMRTIIANNNDDATGGTIEYSGAALSLSAGDWFIVLPPTNFRLIGEIFNNASSNIVGFIDTGNFIQWDDAAISCSVSATAFDITLCSPLAKRARATLSKAGAMAFIAHPDVTATWNVANSVIGDDTSANSYGTVDFTLRNCNYVITADLCYAVGWFKAVMGG